MHAANVALVVVAAGDTYTLAVYSDGNRNGVRTRDIAGGIDPVIDAPVRFSALFPSVSLFLSDPAQAPVPGAGALMSFSPVGTASSRTLYVRGRDHSQYAVRVLGATGRTRLLRYVGATRQWVEVPDVERRRSPRRAVEADEPLAHARLRTGGRLIVLDVSSSGALTETTVRLLPGGRVDLRVTTPMGASSCAEEWCVAMCIGFTPTRFYYRAALASTSRSMRTSSALGRRAGRGYLHRHEAALASPFAIRSGLWFARSSRSDGREVPVAGERIAA